MAYPHYTTESLKPKDLIGIPWRVALALQDAGWYLRQDIIWAKPNPMPESVTDRCTKAHEYVFLLTKQARYYFDAIAIQESSTGHNGIHSFGAQIKGNVRNDGGRALDRNEMPTRNRRSVWTVATSPYSGSHFATFPPKLIEPMILAGSRVNDIVFDPFAGTATVGRVAIQHGRRFVGCDLNMSYIDLAHERTSKVQITMPL